MDIKELLEIVRSAKTKTEILDILGFSQNGRGTKQLILLCESLGFDFKIEFGAYIKKYNNCKYCDNKITLHKKFCNSSCSAKYNNSNRTLSLETKLKISNTLSEKYKSGELIPSYNKTGVCFNTNFGVITSENYDVVNKNYKYICINCNKEYVLSICPSKARKTCSEECRTKMIFKNRSYQNGSRKTFTYYNRFIDTSVFLESSWEVKVAELLDDKNIKWLRPDSITWVDENSKNRQYYPDFYLIDYNLYLDPKNKYCMSLDKYKMKYMEKIINIKYGDVDYILGIINSL